MDHGSQSLLDLLNNSSSASKRTTDKDQLLALFGQRPSQAPTIEAKQTSSPSNRNSNANDLLAALMGNTTPKQSNADSSAALLSSLMGSAKSAYSSSGSLQDTTNYLNPRHAELLRAQPTTGTADTLDKQQEAKPQTKAFFDNSNPFDDLERFQAAQSRSQSTKPSQAVQQSRPGPTPPLHASVIPQRDHSKSSSQDRTSSPIEQIEQIKQEAESRKSVAVDLLGDDAPGNDLPSDASKLVNTADSEDKKKQLALRLPSENSTVLKLSGSKLSSGSLPDLQPITKVALKSDPVSRSLVTASHRYIAYPVTSTPNQIRVIDQDTADSSLLVEHASKVVSLALAIPFDTDGKNALISVDVESNVIVWSITSAKQVEKVFEIAGPSDTSHKARTAWNTAGTYFGVSITSRLYVFDYRSLIANPRSSRVKLNPEMKQALCICKADKAIRGFAFSLDSTAVGAVDKAGNVKFWALESAGRDLSPSASIVLGEKNLSSIHFVGSKHIVLQRRRS